MRTQAKRYSLGIDKCRKIKGCSTRKSRRMNNCPSMGPEAALKRFTAESRKPGGKQYSRENAYNCSGTPYKDIKDYTYYSILSSWFILGYTRSFYGHLCSYRGHLVLTSWALGAHIVNRNAHDMSTTILRQQKSFMPP